MAVKDRAAVRATLKQLIEKAEDGPEAKQALLIVADLVLDLVDDIAGIRAALEALAREEIPARG